MSTLVNILLLLVVVVLVGYPLFRKDQEQAFVEVKATKPKATTQKEIIMSTLGEIEFDYHMNKLSDEDYQHLKHTYSGAAVALLKAEEEGPVKSKGKGKVKAKPAVSKADIEKEIEADLAALKTDKEGFCHRCGVRLKQAKQEYCHSCGERQY